MFLWYASLASVSGGVSFALEAAALSLLYASLASVLCGVSIGKFQLGRTKCLDYVKTRGLRHTHTHTRESAETTKHVEKFIEEI